MQPISMKEDSARRKNGCVSSHQVRNDLPIKDFLREPLPFFFFPRSVRSRKTAARSLSHAVVVCLPLSCQLNKNDKNGFGFFSPFSLI